MSNLPNGGDAPVIQDRNNAPSHHNHFDGSYDFASTERFGEVSPFMFMFGVPDDKNVTFRTSSKLRTMSLASPLLQDLRKNFDYYLVPMRAILPHSWDKIYDNPTQGDDINAEYANCLVSLKDGEFTGLLDVIEQGLHAGAGIMSGETIQTGAYTLDNWDRFVHLLIYCELIFADDSLFAAFRMPIVERLGIDYTHSFRDVFMPQGWKFYHDFLSQFTGDQFIVNFLDNTQSVFFTRSYDVSDVSERMRLIYDIIENPYVQWSSLDDTRAENFYDAVVLNATDFDLWDTDLSVGIGPDLGSGPNVSEAFNVAPILAYQLICAEYFTNDHIDYVFSAERFRDIFEGKFITSNGSVYTYNDNYYPYDGFSAIALGELFGSAYAEFNGTYLTHRTWYALSLVYALFSRKRSLRYVDRFVGSRPLPLAVGDSSINVTVSGNTGSVDAVDVSKGIQQARYLLALNRVGSKAKNYLSGIFGASQRTRNDVPVKVAHIDEVIYGIETQNTGSDQMSLDNSITTNLAGRSSDFAFQTDIDESTIIIGVASYELKRFYTQGWSRFANKLDRFDMFNPYFQYTGDQAVHQDELCAGLDHDLIFGYENKDMEYKVNTDYAIGGFLDNLDGWIFKQSYIKNPLTIGPDFIRAHQCELDRYFVSLTGTTPSSRYHFICYYSNKIDASRNMVFSPQILK